MKRWWAWTAAILIAVGVCLSRLYLGVHDVEDVLGGAILGLVTIIAYRVLISDEFKFWHGANPLLQLAVILAIQPLVWFAWPGTNGPSASFALFGFLFGWWLGVIIERNWIKFGTPSNWLFAVVVSVVAVAALVLSSKLIDQLLLAIGFGTLATGWIHAALIGLYATAFVPFLLKVTRISRLAAS
jgi:glycerophosphoryl diester phosphodiesterase